MKMRPVRRCKAFTLIEVLAALLVLALAMTALQVRIARQLDGAAYLRDQTYAGWVASNRMELLRIASRLGNPVLQQELSGASDMGGSTWYWVITPLPGSPESTESSVTPVIINVGKDSIEGARDTPLYSLSGVTDAAWQL